MKKNVLFSTLAHASNDNGVSVSSTPTNPTRVGQQVTIVAIIAILITFFTGCAVRTPVGQFAFGPGGSGGGCGQQRCGGHPSQMRGGGQPNVPPPEAMVAIERELMSRGQLSPRNIEREVARRYGLSVSVSPKQGGGGFHYQWHLSGGQQYRQAPYQGGNCGQPYGGNYGGGYPQGGYGQGYGYADPRDPRLQNGGYIYHYTDPRTMARHYRGY